MQILQTHDEHQAKDYERIRGLEGFSPELLDTHIGLYHGYVENTNKAHATLRAGGLDTYARAEVRRRLVWEFNGMRLHELYFDALRPGGQGLDPDGPLATALAKDFGSLDAWRADFEATGSMRGIGWAALSYDAQSDRFYNHWIDEHDAGALAGATPLLLMDVFEHAFIRDFGTDRAAYMDAYFDNVDWSTVEARFDAA